MLQWLNPSVAALGNVGMLDDDVLCPAVPHAAFGGRGFTMAPFRNWNAAVSHLSASFSSLRAVLRAFAALRSQYSGSFVAVGIMMARWLD